MINVDAISVISLRFADFVEDMMDYPLQGVRALDCGIFHAGPGALAILADLGAEVIKIEQPGVGDPVRDLMYYGNARFEYKGRSLFSRAAIVTKKVLPSISRPRRGRRFYSGWWGNPIY